MKAPLTMLLFLLLGAMMGSVIGSALALGVAEGMGYDPTTLIGGMESGTSRADRHMIRLINLISHIMTFTVPALLAAYMSTRRDWARFLGLEQVASSRSLLFSILFILAGFPLAQTTYWINQQLPGPEWAHRMEDAAEGMLKSVLTMTGPGEFLFTLLVVAVVPAIGEELFFRGVIQKNLIRLSRRTHLAIWSTAILFSAVHLQFEGFIPRALLGAGLGYLYFWTGSLWAPIVAHFAFNGSQVIAQYMLNRPDQALEIDQVESPQWGLALAGMVVMYFSARQLIRDSSSPAEKTLED